jgi:dTDP-4-dehydrorhamnose reductase
VKILLLGASGQLGFELSRSLDTLGDLVATARNGGCGRQWRQLDLTENDPLSDTLAQESPDLIVNAAAFTAVDRAEDEPLVATRLNATVPATLAGYAARHDAALVHFSTDYVFDGQADRAYVESDVCKPQGIYGSSKLSGEVAIRDTGCRHLILRTSWVYGARGKNFLLTILGAARERDQLSIVDDQWGSPTWTCTLARLTALAIGKLRQASDWRRLGGTYHVSASGKTTWFRFADHFIKLAVEKGLLQSAPELKPVSTADYPTRARRPAWSVLDNSAFEKAFGLQVPDWETQLQLCLQGIHAMDKTPSK